MSEETIDRVVLKHCCVCQTVWDGDKKMNIKEFTKEYDQQKYSLSSGMHSKTCLKQYVENNLEKYNYLPDKC